MTTPPATHAPPLPTSNPPAAPSRRPLPLPIEFLVALGAVGASIGLRHTLDPVLGNLAPFIFTLAVLAVLPWIVRAVPYFVAAVIGVVATEFFIAPPRWGFAVANATSVVQVLCCLLLCTIFWTTAALARRHAARSLAAAHTLRERDALLRTVAHGSTTLMTYVDADLRYRFVNDAYCRYFNVRPEKVVGRTITEQLGPDAYERLRPHLDDVFAGRTAEFEDDIPYMSRGTRRMRIAYVPDTRPDGSVAGFTAAIHDVTDERRETEAMARGEERFRLATEALQGVVYDWDHTTGIVMRSAGLAGLIGVPADAATRTAAWWASRIHPDDLRRIEQAHAGAVGRREPGVETEYRVRHDDDRWVWVWDHARHVYAADGSLARTVGSIVSIDDRKLAEEALRESRDVLSVAMRGGRMGAWSRDLITDRVWWSRELEEIFGLPMGGFEGTEADFFSLIHEEDRPLVVAAVDTGITDRTDYAVEFRFRHADGSWRWMEGRGRAVYSSAGRPTMLFGVGIDITHRKEAEDALRRSEGRLAAEAAAMARLNGASSRLWSAPDLRTGLHELLIASIELLGADMGNVQILDPERGVLIIRAQHGLPQSFLDAFKEVKPGRQAVCSSALEARSRIIVEDVEADETWAALAPIAREAGFRAVQSTPLIGADGEIVGVLSTHFRRPHRPTEDQLRWLDLFTREAADVIQRGRAADALRESESRLRLALQASGAAVWTLDIPTGAAFWTDEFFPIYGYTAETPRTYDTWLASVHPDDRDAVRTDLADCIAARAPEFRKEFRIVHPQRGVRWILDIGRIEYDAAGQPLRAGGINLDITDRKRTEQQLLRNHETFFNLIENAPFGVYVVDSGFRLRQVSAGSQKVFANVRPLLGRDFAEVLRILWPEPFAAEAIARFRHTLATGEPYASPDMTERRNDIPQTESYDWKIERITLPDGQFGVVCYFYDMTERRRAEAALLESERLLQTAYAELEAIYAQSPLGMAQLDRDLRFVRVNDALAAMNGLPAAAHIGRTVREIIPEVADKAEEQMQTLLAGQPVLNAEFSGTSPAKPGVTGTWLESWYPLRDADGEIVGVNAVVQDITDRKRAETELARYRDHLEQLVRERTAELEKSQAALRLSERMAALGTFAAGLGHDITNTLLPLRVRVEELIADPNLDQRTRSEVLAIVGFLKYLQSLARGLRLFAQDPDRPAGPEDRTDLTAWWDDTFAFFRASVPASIDLACDIPPGLPRVAVAPHRLSQAILNLVHNARDAIAAARGGGGGGRITIAVRAEVDRRTVTLSVTDDGAGMSDETRRRCIEPFYSTKTRGMGGTGLGLAMVHGIASSAGGDLVIDSAPGRGATVTLRLPAVPAAGHVDDAQRRTTFITVADKRIEAFATALVGALGRRAVAAPPPAGVERPGDCWITDASAAPHDRAHAFVERTGPNHLIVLGDPDGWPAPPPAGAVVIPGGSPIGRLREALTSTAVLPDPDPQATRT